MKHISIALAAVAALCAGLAAQEMSTLEKIRVEGMEHSKVLEPFDYLTTVIGPRLTNSPAH